MTTDTITKTKTNTELAEPSNFKVIYKNDNQTTFEFVVNSCVEHFDYTLEDGFELAKKVNDIGSAVVAVLPHEIAEQKSNDIILAARAQGFPFVVKIEKNV